MNFLVVSLLLVAGVFSIGAAGSAWFVVACVGSAGLVIAAISTQKRKWAVLGAYVLSLPGQWALLSSAWQHRPGAATDEIDGLLAYCCELDDAYFRQADAPGARTELVSTAPYLFFAGEPLFCGNPWEGVEPLWSHARSGFSTDQAVQEHAELVFPFWTKMTEAQERHNLHLPAALSALRERCAQKVREEEYASIDACVGTHLCSPWKVAPELCAAPGYDRAAQNKLIAQFAPFFYLKGGLADAPRSAAHYAPAAQSAHSLAQVQGSASPLVYARFLPRSYRRAILQYWLFWPGDRLVTPAFTQTHEGDWEVVTVEIARNGNGPNAFGVSWVAGSQHYWSYTIRKNVSTVETHPKVLVAKGSHALYLPGETHPLCPVEIDSGPLTLLAPDQYEVARIEDQPWNTPDLRWGISETNWDDSTRVRIPWTNPDTLSAPGVLWTECDSPFGSILCAMVKQEVSARWMRDLTQSLSTRIETEVMRGATDYVFGVAARRVVTLGVCEGPSDVIGFICAAPAGFSCAGTIVGAAPCSTVAGGLCSWITGEVCFLLASLFNPELPSREREAYDGMEDARERVLTSAADIDAELTEAVVAAMTCTTPP
jgi:hypothetical protein